MHNPIAISVTIPLAIVVALPIIVPISTPLAIRIICCAHLLFGVHAGIICFRQAKTKKPAEKAAGLSPNPRHSCGWLLHGYLSLSFSLA